MRVYPVNKNRIRDAYMRFPSAGAFDVLALSNVDADMLASAEEL
jgi:hypothetical protein